jgi:hypothetical protein
MKRTLIVMAILALIAAAAAVAGAQIPADKEVLEFEHKLGNVTFEHAKHAGYEGVTCVTCHHKTEGDAMPQACVECHPKKVEKGSEDLKLQDAVHNQWWSCHQEKIDAGLKGGPVKGAKNCKQCHIRG